VTPEESVRAKALELAVLAQSARGISDPREIVNLAEIYAVYIRLGMDGCEGMLK
jgi:hypothetical protein